ncbi:MAG: hypothetical protein BWK76_18185 [Desulfobulbaceae bacterium A2]|nr:MAG: hypothetical protein BWK76_18185 [Desulfobulbaceae bacterium A2]
MSQHAYWITPAGIILRPAIRHIGTVLRCPEAFGETEASIRSTCEQYGERISLTFEGRARNEILTRVICRGFIRIRKETSKHVQHWSIQFSDLTPVQHAVLSEWAALVRGSGLDPFADVILHCLRDNRTTRKSIKELAGGRTAAESDCQILSEETFCAGSDNRARD